jgi:TIGR03009 family protein
LREAGGHFAFLEGDKSMRLLGYTFAALLLNSAVLWAQQQPPSAPPINIPPKPGTPAEPANLLPKLDPQNNRLDKLLLDWEKRMTGVDSIACKCAREEKSKASGFKKVYEGEARYLKPNMVALRMIMPSDKTIWELYVFTGKHLWEYRPQTKTLRIHEMAPEQTNFQNNFLSFLFGMNAADAKRRYELSLTKEDQHYIYIDVKPRFDADKREFSRAQMVLFTKNRYRYDSEVKGIAFPAAAGARRMAEGIHSAATKQSTAAGAEFPATEQGATLGTMSAN